MQQQRQQQQRRLLDEASGAFSYTPLDEHAAHDAKKLDARAFSFPPRKKRKKWPCPSFTAAVTSSILQQQKEQARVLCLIYAA